MMEYLAHSAKEDCPPQSYEAHVKGVFLRAVKYAGEAESYALKCRGNWKMWRDAVLFCTIWANCVIKIRLVFMNHQGKIAICP